MRRRKGTRIYGPYRRGDAWIVAVVEEDGGRSDRRCESEAEAEKFVDDTRKALKLEGPITVEEALEEYEGHQRARGKKAGSIATTQQRMRSLLAPIDGGKALVRVSCAEGYAALADRVSVDTHRNALGEARTFGKWCVKRGYLRHNPWAEVEAVGKRKRGKLQLRVTEAQKFLAKALELAAQGDDGAAATLPALLLGFGASEICERVGRDVDDDGRLFWIDRGKTENRQRVIEVPEILAPHLDRLARAAGPEGRLWPHNRLWVLAQVKRVCRLAGVLVVTVHGLRGTQASIASAQGATTHLVAATLGNTAAVAQRHYAEPGAVATGRSKRALSVLAGGRK